MANRLRVETIGDATLYLGDCREILPTLPKVDAVVTSPPYNQLGNRIPKKPAGMWGKRGFGLAFVKNVNGKGYADDLDEGAYQDWQNKLFSEINTTDKASLFYNHQCRWRDGELLHPIVWFRPPNWRLRQEIIWDRGGGMMFNARMFCRFDERILWFCKSSHKWNQRSVGLGTIWKISVQQNKEHPVAYPIDLPRRCIEAVTDIGDLVLDPFSGSASTGISALRIGRKFIGIEINPQYFDIACRRIEEESRQEIMAI